MPRSFVPPEQYYAGLARVRQGAGALITTPDGRVVMYDVTYRDYLELPGGAVEVGESPPAACARECREELGVDVRVGRLLVLDHQTDGGDRGDSVMFVYDGGVVDESALGNVPADDEGRGVVLVDPSDLDRVTISRLANRIRSARAARETGGVVEAVNGEIRTSQSPIIVSSQPRAK
ncbi:NUDIX hydrolase [Mycobacterium hodleri]|uniref:NUDIX hydrolase n=1 Tax=Mycolicibacterium hodleri TaxID=49897 RepID=A0A544VRK7_9MYCO|nr:NUDIX hydrolase [Mycolicibacterium hodleri]TQR82607.1 NUDIX hydrolase [Mycolicibacterium hodleri]